MMKLNIALPLADIVFFILLNHVTFSAASSTTISINSPPIVQSSTKMPSSTIDISKVKDAVSTTKSQTSVVDSSSNSKETGNSSFSHNLASSTIMNINSPTIVQSSVQTSRQSRSTKVKDTISTTKSQTSVVDSSSNSSETGNSYLTSSQVTPSAATTRYPTDISSISVLPTTTRTSSANVNSHSTVRISPTSVLPTTTATSSANTTRSDKESDEGLSNAQIAGIAGGSSAAVVLLISVLIVVLYKHKKSEKHAIRPLQNVDDIEMSPEENATTHDGKKD